MNPPALHDFLERISLSPSEITHEDFLYIFGRNPELSLAEIIARYHVHGIEPVFRDITVKGAVLQGSKPISISHCGSVLRRCDIITRIPYTISAESLYKYLFDYLDSEYMEDKANWAISNYNLDTFNPKEFSLSFSDRVYNQVKQVLKKIRIRKTQLLREFEKNAISPRKLQRKEVLERGFEIVLWFQPDHVILAYTREVIDIDGFAKRDMDRPNKRPLLLLGLALARTMVNLVSIKENRHHLPIYDPFCGMGSIPAEAYMLGVEAYGSDIDVDCVGQTQENLHWLSTNRKYRQDAGTFPKNQIFQMDVTKPLPTVFPWADPFTGSIVAETNLLTPLKSYPTHIMAQQMLHEFEHNYHQYLQGLTSFLDAGGIGVMIFPQIHTEENSREKLNVERLLGEYNCKILSVSVNGVEYPAYFVHNWKNPIIERLIVVFQKK